MVPEKEGLDELSFHYWRSYPYYGLKRESDATLRHSKDIACEPEFQEVVEELFIKALALQVFDVVIFEAQVLDVVQQIG